MARPFLAIAAALVLAWFAVPAASAQSSLAARLETERLGTIQPGDYQAGEHVNFTLARAGDNFLLRFKDDPEIFVLYADRASLGARVLNYDSGETALRVAGWGGMTLYTDKNPGGLPAVRVGDAAPLTQADASLDDVKNAAADEAQHLAYSRRLKLSFSTDWNALAGDPDLRALCFDTIENTAGGIDRFAASAEGQRALAAAHLAMVLVIVSGKPTLQLKGKQLTVTYDPRNGYAGRASSRAIARALRIIFHVKVKAD